jgi:hypothetical protein
MRRGVPTTTTRYSVVGHSRFPDRASPLKKKHALVLYGDGAFGAFHAGWAEAVARLDKTYNPDVLVGVSFGALAAGVVSQFDTFRDGAMAYSDIWRNDIRSSRDVYRTRRWRRPRRTAKPLRDLIERHFLAAAVKKDLRVAGIDLTTGETTIWTESNMRDSKPVYIASALSVAFEPFAAGQSLFVSGVSAPVKMAIDAGAQVVDVLTSGPGSYADQHLRALSLMSHALVAGDIAYASYVNSMVRAGADSKHREVDVRVHRPESPLFGSALDFDSAVVRRNKTTGAEVATAWLYRND